MRQPRLKALPGHPFCYHHVLSRVVNRDFVFGDLEKEHFVRLMRRYEIFCGVRVLTFCILSNHFHILLEVPARPRTPLSDPELLSRCAAIYSPKQLQQIRQELQLLQDQPEQWAAYREQYLCRMWDLSQYMKSLKQRFTQWFNASRPTRRKGTLWEERYRSVLAEGTAQALSTLAAYIDLNPVRAGIVSDPKEYRWSGYGAAVGGNTRARKGLRRLAPPGVQELTWYRKLLYAEGTQEGVSTADSPVRTGLDPEKAREVWESGGELSLSEVLRCRVRYFADGAVLGSREFANEVFRVYRSQFGATRKDGARPMRGLATSALNGLFTLRDLRLGVRKQPSPSS